MFPTVDEDVKLELLQSGSQDCVVIKEADIIGLALLLCKDEIRD